MTSRQILPVAPTALPVPLLADLLTLSKAAKLLADRPHVKSLERWHARGMHGFRLRVARQGRTVLTCSTWLAEFLAACGGAGRSEDQPKPAAPQASTLSSRTEMPASRSTTKRARVDALLSAGVRR